MHWEDTVRLRKRTERVARTKLYSQKATNANVELQDTHRTHHLIRTLLKAKTCLSPDRKVLVQIWLSKKSELSGKRKISPVFNCRRSAARSLAKTNVLNSAWSRAKIKICEGSKDELCGSRVPICREITARSARRTGSAWRGAILDCNCSVHRQGQDHMWRSRHTHFLPDSNSVRDQTFLNFERYKLREPLARRMIYKTSRGRPIRTIIMNPFIRAGEWVTEMQNIYSMANPTKNLLS